MKELFENDWSPKEWDGSWERGVDMRLKARGVPPRWERAVAWFLLLSMLCLVTGCGNGNQDFVVTNTNNNPGTSPADGFFMGRVLLDDYAAGDQITLEGLDGGTLYTLTTNSSGVFYAYGPLPSDFRILVVRPGENVVHSREIRGGYFGGTMWVNPMTTLTSRLVQANPSLTLQQASDKVHDYLEVARGFDEDWVTNSEASAFRPVAFYQEANDSGGIEAHYDEIVSLLVNPTANAEASEGAVLSFVKTVGGDLLGDTVSVVDAGAFGAVTQFFGLNLGTSGQLHAIEQQLTAVVQELGDLENAVGVETITGDYNSDRDAMEPSLVDISNFSKALKAAMAGGGGSVLNVSEILDVEDDIALLENYLIGNNVDNIIFAYAEYLLNAQNGMGLSTTDIQRYQGYPIRKNSNTQLLQQNLEVYLNYHAQGLNNRAELAHMSVPPASALSACVADFDAASKVSFQALAQVPAKLSSDDFVLDLEQGHMLIAVFQPQDSYYNANNIANNWDEGGYDDWRLPSRDELEGFVQNRIGPAHTSDDNGGWETGFLAFGFDTTHYAEQTYHKNASFGGNTDPQGQAFFDIDTDSGINNQDVYQWSGVDGAPATASYGNDSGNQFGDFSTYLVYRIYANPAVETDFSSSDPLAYATLPDSPSVLNITLKDQLYLDATTSYDAKGVTTQAYEVGFRTYWSSNSAMATVSNYPGSKLDSDFGIDPGPIGQITWHPPIDGSPLTPVTFTGTLYGPSYGGGGGAGPITVGSITGSLTVDPPTGLTPNATSLQVLPFDKVAATVSNEFDVSTIPPTGARLFDVYGTTFYEDGQFHDVTPDDGPTGAVYSFLDSQGNLIDSSAEGGGFIDSDPYVLVLESNLPPGLYTIRIEYVTPTGQDLTGTLPFTVDGIAI